MSYRKLVLGLSVVGLLILAGTALAEKDKKPTAVIRSEPVMVAPGNAPVAQVQAVAPQHAQVSDALDPIEFKPAPMDAYETVGGPQVVYPHAEAPVPAIYPSPAYAPHVGMATRVVTSTEHCAPPALPSHPQTSHALAPVAQFPLPCPATEGCPMATTPPAAPTGYAYPAAPAFHLSTAPAHPHYIVAPRPLTKSELLRGALCHLEAAGADDLVKLVRIEVVTEEKRELAEELARKDAELQALKSDVAPLRAQVEETKEEPANEASGEAKPTAPQVKFKVQVLDVNVAQMKALGLNEVDLTGAKVEPNLASLINAKILRDKSEPESPATPCPVGSNEHLHAVLEKLRAENAVKVVAEPCVTVESGKRKRFCCGMGKTVVMHGEDETCDVCLSDGVELDVLVTIFDNDCIRTSISERQCEATVLASHTTGLEGPLPPAERRTYMNACFDAKSGQTFVASMWLQADEAPADDSEGKSEKADADEPAKTEGATEKLRLILVTPCLTEEAHCSDAPNKCSCECPCEKCSQGKSSSGKCTTEKCSSQCPSSQCPSSQFPASGCSSCPSSGCTSKQCPPSVFETTTADGIRLRMMREPFLKDVQLGDELNLSPPKVAGMHWKYLNGFHPVVHLISESQSPASPGARNQRIFEPVCFDGVFSAMPERSDGNFQWMGLPHNPPPAILEELNRTQLYVE